MSARRDVPVPAVLSEPVVHARITKKSGGTFTVYNFSLAFDPYRIYWRRFGVDVPNEAQLKKCPKKGCPVLVDFPGSGDDLYTQRAWTRWFKYQDETDAPYILVTMEGSPDAVFPPGTEPNHILPCTIRDRPSKCRSNAYISTGGTSWNVLGWGSPTPVIPTGETPVRRAAGNHFPRPDQRRGDPTGLYPDDGEAGEAALDQEAGATEEQNGYGQICREAPQNAACFSPALYPWISYQCFGTHLAADPAACQNVTYGGPPPGRQFLIPSSCASASGANDWDYVKSVLYYVTSSPLCRRRKQGWCGNKDRIYFTGQSMGGMASIQFAVPQRDNKYNMGPYRPKAIAACSAGGSRNNEANLEGMVPTLLMQGYKDSIAPGSVWAGWNRKDPNNVKESYLIRTERFEQLWTNDNLVRGALQTVGLGIAVPGADKRGQRTNVLLNADTQTGGAFLSNYTRRAARANMIGCKDNFLNNALAVGIDSYMWETFGTTLARVAGGRVVMTRLSYTLPAEFRDDAIEIQLTCANATKTASSAAEIQVCTFKGGHTYPWIGTAVEKPDTFHKFVWEWWLKGGNRV